MQRPLVRAFAFLLLTIGLVPGAGAHEPSLRGYGDGIAAISAECQRALATDASVTYIPDAELLLREPRLIERLGDARLILGGWVLEELTAAAEDPRLKPAVDEFSRALGAALKVPLGERRVRVDNLSYVKELTDTGLDRTISTTKLLALAHHYAFLKPVLLTDNVFLSANATSFGIATESFDVINPLTDPNARDMFRVDISDEEMAAFERDRVLPAPADFALQPNQFAQFRSPGTPAGKNTVGRYIYERPKLIHAKSNLVGNRLELAQNEIKPEYIDTIRIKVNGEVAPRFDSNPKDDGGWTYDGQGTFTFVGKRYVPAPGSVIEVLVQQRPHRIEALRTYKEMGVRGRELSFEQLMLMNLLMDPSIDCVIVVGVAGASKTYSAASAVLALMEKFPKLKGKVTRVPAHVGARDPGTYPGGMKEKAGPWILALLSNLGQILGKEMRDLPAGWENLEFGYLRGQSLSDSIVLFDEAQNSTRDLMKTMVTRIGRGSRIFIMGDVDQRDENENLRLSVSNNGLAAAVAALQMPNVSREEKSRVAVIRLKKTVRSELAAIAARAL